MLLVIHIYGYHNVTVLLVQLYSQKYINARLTEQYFQSWYAYNSSKASNYKLFKHTFAFETYITILEKKYWCPLIRFRLSNHNLPIETGRWENVTIQNRICPLCNNFDIGDEFHYIFTCTFFKNERNRFLPSFCQSKPNIYKLLKLFNSKKAGVLRRRSIFCSLIMNFFKSSGLYYVVVVFLYIHHLVKKKKK